LVKNFLDHKQHIHFPRQIQHSASRSQCALLFQKPAHYCLCYRQSLELSPTQDIMNIVKLALAPDNHPTTAVATLEPQSSTLSTRSSNSK
jgi:hypothetical protein